MRVLPILELRPAHVERTVADFPQLDVGATDDEFAEWKAHRRTAVAAPARLVKHQRAMLCAKPGDQLQRFRRCVDSVNHGSLLEKKGRCIAPWKVSGRPQKSIRRSRV